jgi:PAS domain S-box-containing protein
LSATEAPEPDRRLTPRPDDETWWFRRMVEAAPAYFYIADPATSKTLYRSRQAEQMLGYTMVEWRDDPEIWSKGIHADDRDRVLGQFAAAAQGGKPFRAEYRIRTKSGKFIWVRDHASLVEAPSGVGFIFLGVVLDVTEQKTLEQAARQALLESAAKSKFIDSVFDNSPLGVAKVDAHWRIIEANRRLRQMLSPDLEMVGMSLAEYLDPEWVDNVAEEFRPLWVGEAETIEADAQVRRRSGERLWVHWTATTVKDPDGDLDYFLAMFEDISAKHAAEAAAMASLEELDRLNRLKSEFISIVSHEFRTALTGIQGFSEIMRDAEGLSPEEIKDFATDINNDALRLNRMITEMLDLDRMESGRMTLQVADVDLNAIVDDSVGRARAAHPLHHFRTELDSALPAFRADSDRLTQVVANLLSNAAKYSPEGQEILVRSSHDFSTVKVAITDKGMGIPAEHLDKVFQRYERFGRDATTKIMGTGLGLPISRQIIELHKGKIWVESEEGKGSTFSFSIPIA